MERIVGLEGVRTTPAFLQGHGHARLELIRLRSPAYEARLPAHAEFVGELKRYHDSHRLCNVRRPRGLAIRRGEKIRQRVCPSRLSLGRSGAPEKSRRKGSIGSSALALASCRFAAGRLRGRGAHGCGGYGFGEGCMGWDLDAVAMVGDQERRPLEQRVGRLVPVELDLESSAAEEDAEGEPFELGRQPG